MRISDIAPAQPTDPDQVPWWNAWGQLKQIVAQLDQAVASLQANRDYALSRPDLAATYQSKMDDVESMRSKATWIRDQIKSAFDYFGIQLSGLRYRASQSLGFLPALLWPVVAIAVTWLGSKALDLWQFSQQVDEQRRLEQGGMPPAQAAALVKGKKEAGTLADSLKAFTPYLIGGGILFVGYLIWKKGKRS